MSSRILSILVLACLGTACGPEDAPSTEPVDPSSAPLEIRVGMEQNGGSTALQVGHVLRVELAANPLTGCVWEVVEVDEAVMRMPFEEYVPPAPDEPDAPGTSIWRFEALGAGSTAVKLHCVKFGDDVPTEEKTFSFRVIVD